MAILSIEQAQCSTVTKTEIVGGPGQPGKSKLTLFIAGY